MHMHEGAIKILNADTIEWTWHAWQNGKPLDGHTVSMTLARKK